MPTVSGFTAERSQAIEDGTIVSGTVVGDDLILTKHDGTTIDAGSVRGPQGNTGAGGGDLTSAYELLSPVGGMQPFGGSTAPTGWKICDGTSYLRTDYPDLFTAIGTAYGAVDSTHFNVPDLRLKVPVGKTISGTGSVLGTYGGNKDAITVIHSHNHSHSISIGNAGSHVHGVAGDTGFRIVVTIGSPGFAVPNSGPQNVTFTGMDAAGDHNHGASASADATLTGGSPTDANLPPYAVVNWIIRY